MNQKTVKSKKWFVYIVKCANGSYYTGVTDNIERRIHEHNTSQGSRYTRSFGPVRLLWSETQPTYGAALKREAQIKRCARAKKKALINDALELLKKL